MSVVYQILQTALLTTLLAGSVLGLALGAGLLMRSARAAAFMSAMNRWVSLRRMLKPVEVPRDTGHGGRGLGAVLLVASGYSLLVLAPVPLAKLAAALRLGSGPLALIALETAKWLLVVGCVASLAAGAMLVFFPRAWRSVEERANRWYSSRQITVHGDDMHVPLERIAETYPRAAGGIILALSLASTAATALLLSRP